MKTIAKKHEIKESAIYALKSGVNVKVVKDQLLEHGINSVKDIHTRVQMINHLITH